MALPLPALPAASTLFRRASPCLTTFTLRRHGRIAIRRTLCKSKGLKTTRSSRLPFAGGGCPDDILVEDLQRRNAALEKEVYAGIRLRRDQILSANEGVERLKLELLLGTKREKDARRNEIDELKANLQNVQRLLDGVRVQSEIRAF